MGPRCRAVNEESPAFRRGECQVIGSGNGEKYVFVSERRGRSATYLIASQEGGLRTGIGAWHDVLAEIGVR